MYELDLDTFRGQEFDLKTTNYVALAGFTILVYDHIITFRDEAKYIWRAKKKIVIWLFLINRYLTPLGFIVNLDAFLSPDWSTETCARFVVYEGVMGLVGVAIASLMMIVRIYALYPDNRWVLASVWMLFFAMVGIHAWLFTTTGPVMHPHIHGCSMLFGVHPTIGAWTSATAWSPLCFDTAVVILVVYRTRSIVRARLSSQSKIVDTLLRDGIMYFSVILAINLVLAIMIVKSANGVKNVCAQLQLLLTVTMMSRITLNLRKNMDNPPSLPTKHVNYSLSENSYADIHLAGFKTPRQVLHKLNLPSHRWK